METVTNVENALIKGATRRQNFSEINKIPEEEEEEGSVHLQGGVRRQVSSSRFIAKAVTERTPAAEWAAATRPSLKSLPDSFSPWPVAICKVQRRISQGPSYRVTVRATKCYDSPIISATIPYANDPLNNDFLFVGKRIHDTTIFYLTCRNFFSILIPKCSRIGPTIRGEALLPNVCGSVTRAI